MLAEFGIEAVGAVMDPDPLLALDDAVRAFRPERGPALLPAGDALRADARATWSSGPRPASRCPVTHVPVRIDDDAVRWDVTHTLVVATQTAASPELIAQPEGEGGASRPHRYTFICPRSGDLSREEVCERLARLLAELYRNEIDATGQPMSPEPFAAIENAIESLPDRRDPDLDPRRPAVEVARGRA